MFIKNAEYMEFLVAPGFQRDRAGEI